MPYCVPALVLPNVPHILPHSPEKSILVIYGIMLAAKIPATYISVILIIYMTCPSPHAVFPERDTIYRYVSFSYGAFPKIIIAHAAIINCTL